MGKNAKKCSTSKAGKILWYVSTAASLGARGVTALSLIIIATMLCSVKQESKVFNQCVEEIRNSGKSLSAAVRFCNGGGT
tara:strand:+ start:185 stop:424 length:240 start_codon:yes stop_codon:yes gene_type:complete